MEIFFLAHNRRAFTEAALAALFTNTNWREVSGLVLYDDASTDGADQVLEEYARRAPVQPTLFKRVKLGGPVACMNDYITTRRPDMFAKIDSDTMVPPGWLGDCLNVMTRHPWLDLLGIEPMTPTPVTPAPETRWIDECAHIGGIGLMRGRAFEYSLPRPDGRFGFTAWQQSAMRPGDGRPERVRPGWLRPALPVFLLDRMPIEPWRSLSDEYIAKGWQRYWSPYSLDMNRQWEWFTK